MSPLTRLRALDPRRLPEAGVLVTDGEADAVAEVLAAGVATGEARAWCVERVRVWRAARRGAR